MQNALRIFDPNYDSRHQPSVPAELRHFLRRGLQPSKTDRFQNADTVLLDLERIRSGEPPIQCAGTLIKVANARFERLVDRHPLLAISLYATTACLFVVGIVTNVPLFTRRTFMRDLQHIDRLFALVLTLQASTVAVAGYFGGFASLPTPTLPMWVAAGIIIPLTVYYRSAAFRECIQSIPYGATTMAKDDGSRMPSANELSIAKFQGKHVAEITAKLATS